VGQHRKDYREVDWLALYPSVHDGLHPFASYKKPVNGVAHPVFQYDEPIVSVVIPVGPGHEKSVRDALDSVESQREFRKWEVIVVWDAGDHESDDLKRLRKEYPYVRYVVPGHESRGPGYARNRGAEAARAKFLVFLDADDMLMPNFMNRTLEAWGETPSIIYTDYLGSAIISEAEAEKHRAIGKLRQWTGPDAVSVIGYPSREPQDDFDCVAAQSMPRFPLYHWCLVTCLIPVAWHNEIGGFDETMESWEDVDYHWRMAWAGKCYARVPEELVMYRFLSGSRRSTASADTEEGRQIGRKLLRYIDEKKEHIEMAGCSGCGGRRSPTVVNTRRTPVSRVTSVTQAPTNDQDFDLYYYTSPNRGDHRLIGGHVFPQRIQGFRMSKAEGGGFRIDYGYHSGGESKPFLVHNLDAAAQHGFFQKASVLREAPPVERPEPEEPKPVELVEQAEEPNNVDPLANLANSTPPPPEKPPTTPDDTFDPQTIPGVASSIAKQLVGRTLEDLKGMTHADWCAIKGVHTAKADMITDYLAKLE